MEEDWPPLKRRIPDEFAFFTKDGLVEVLEISGAPGDAPIWLYNYRQAFRDTTKRPMDGMATGSDGIHIW